LASRLKEKNVIDCTAKVTYFRYRNSEYITFYKKVDNMVYCSDIHGLFKAFGQRYSSSEWRLFIDSSKISLKAVLFHNGNLKPSIPIAHSVILKETFVSIQKLFDAMQYKEFNWHICADLKMIAILFGMQGGFTKHCCFLCLWDSRATTEHDNKSKCPKRKYFIPGKENITNIPLVEPDNILLSSLHIKIGLIKIFIKSLAIKESSGFKYLIEAFPKISSQKMKEAVFDGPQIREMLRLENFEATLNEIERKKFG